jgi:hypothetical protein
VRTSISLNDGPFCGAGVVDHETCRPGDYGGKSWQQANDFPPYTLSDFRGRGGVRLAAAEIRAHYLGSLYYDGDLHSFCKSYYDLDRLALGSTTLQEYDLAEMIERRVVRPLTTLLRGELVLRAPSEAAGIADRFYEHLTEEVHERVQAHIVWFVSRYQGGVSDMAHDDRLRDCLREARAHDAAVVTGVAGYVVLENNIDDRVSSVDVVYHSMDRATAGYSHVMFDDGLRSRMAVQWQEGVTRIATIGMTRQEITTTAWPMWVQFE